MQTLWKFLSFWLLIAHLLSASDSAESFLKKIPKEEVSILDSGFQRILKSFGGYVLYGDKPMCIESMRQDDQVNLYYCEEALAKNHLFQILKNWNLTSVDRDYLFISSKHLEHNHLIIINRKAFIQTVNDNISLFRYIIDPKLTAESLLYNLSRSGDDFYKILKDDIALLGVLLGYGVNNSIAHARYETLLNAIKYPKIDFPYLTTPLEQIFPSHGFQSLNQELSSSSLICSWDISKQTSYRVPFFGCTPDTEETAHLISTYEKNREELIKAAQQENFLPSFLARICKTASGEVQFPNISPRTSCFDPSDKEGLIDQFAQAIHAETHIDGLNQKKLIQAFLKGVNDQERGQKQDFNLTLVESKLFRMPAEIKKCQRLEEANRLITKASKLKNWVPLIENNIIYKVIKKGKGELCSLKATDLSFHYSFRPLSNPDLLKVGTIEKQKIDQLIPGISHLLIGMRKGEERTAYIHSRYAYGDSDPFPNESFLITLHLIDFKEGSEEVSISQPSSLSLPESSSMDLLAEYQKLQEQHFYHCGYSLGNSLENLGIKIGSQALQKRLCTLNNFTVNKAETATFILDFKAHLFHSKYLAKQIPITPFCF